MVLWWSLLSPRPWGCWTPLPNGHSWFINRGDPNYLQVLGWSSKYPLVNNHIAIAGMTSPFLIGNTSTQSGSIFQPAMLDYRSVITLSPEKSWFFRGKWLKFEDKDPIGDTPVGLFIWYQITFCCSGWLLGGWAPRTCKWLGSPPFISQNKAMDGRGPTTRSWGDLWTKTNHG